MKIIFDKVDKGLCANLIMTFMQYGNMVATVQIVKDATSKRGARVRHRTTGKLRHAKKRTA